MLCRIINFSIRASSISLLEMSLRFCLNISTIFGSLHNNLKFLTILVAGGGVLAPKLELINVLNFAEINIFLAAMSSCRSDDVTKFVCLSV